MITSRDRQILSYLSEYRYATISQLERVIFRDQQYSYNIARRRLERLKEADYIKVHRDLTTNKNVYIINDKYCNYKPPSHHRLLVLDVLAEMHYMGFTIESFEIEKEWNDGKVRSDAFAVFTIEDPEGKKRRYRYFVEVQISNNDHRLQKYDELRKTGLVQKETGSDVYPRILLVSDRNYGNIKDVETTVIQVDTRLNDFHKVLL